MHRAHIFLSSLLVALSFVLLPAVSRADDDQEDVAKKARARRNEDVRMAGLGVVAGAYAYQLLTATIYRDSEGKVPAMLFVPIAGPYVALRGMNAESTLTGRLVDATCTTSTDSLGYRSRNCYAGLFLFSGVGLIEAALYFGAPVAQVVGLTIAGGAADKSEPATTAWSRARVSIVPTQGMHGIALSVRGL